MGSRRRFGSVRETLTYSVRRACRTAALGGGGAAFLDYLLALGETALPTRKIGLSLIVRARPA